MPRSMPDSGADRNFPADSNADSGPEDEPTSLLQSTHTHSSTQTEKPRITTTEPILRHRKTPVFLLVVYLPTLIVPWVLLFILAHRPLRGSSYFDQTGKNYGGNAVGVAAANVLKSVNAVLAVPILSTLLGHAAVVYAMRRREDQKLNLRQLFALADKGWADIFMMRQAVTETGSGHALSSAFLWWAALLVGLGAILQPLTSLLVSVDPIAVTTCLDIPQISPHTSCSQFGPPVVGYDPEPADMPFLQPDLVLQDVLGQLSTASDVEFQPNLWPVNPDLNAFIDGVTNPIDRQILFAYSPDSGQNPEGFFVTALVNGTNTGVLREHALRLNSSTHCELISATDFPSSCSGENPLVVDVQRELVGLRVCAPGAASTFPFTPSRNRQDITEELYLDMKVFPNVHHPAIDAQNFTMHCVASTSRGYFEIGNVQNDYVYGPLLDKWPSPDYIAHETNDFRSADADDARPTEEDPSTVTYGALDFSRIIVSPFTEWIPDNGTTSVPGPLMVSNQVLFGNYSFLKFLSDDNPTNMTSTQRYASLCEAARFPLSQVIGLIGLEYGYCADAARKIAASSGDEDDDFDYSMSMTLIDFAKLFNSTSQAEYAFMISMYYANRAVLTKTASNEGLFQRRNIYSASGTMFPRPGISLASLIVITALIFLQLVGLAIVTRLIYSVPTWTSSLNALEMARIGRTLGDADLPPLGVVMGEKDMNRLARIDALVGVPGARIGSCDVGAEEPGDEEERGGGHGSRLGAAENYNGKAASEAAEAVLYDANSEPIARLAVGGEGIITPGVAKALARTK